MIIIILPAYNEENSIGSLLQDFCESFEEEIKEWRIIIVNDGSTDNTESIVSRYQGKIQMDIITHPENRGLAEAFKTGLIRAVETSSDIDIIASMDSDGSHLPGLLSGTAVAYRLCFAGSRSLFGSPFHRHHIAGRCGQQIAQRNQCVQFFGLEFIPLIMTILYTAEAVR